MVSLFFFYCVQVSVVRGWISLCVFDRHCGGSFLSLICGSLGQAMCLRFCLGVVRSFVDDLLYFVADQSSFFSSGDVAQGICVYERKFAHIDTYWLSLGIMLSVPNICFLRQWVDTERMCRACCENNGNKKSQLLSFVGYSMHLRRGIYFWVEITLHCHVFWTWPCHYQWVLSIPETI